MPLSMKHPPGGIRPGRGSGDVCKAGVGPLGLPQQVFLHASSSSGGKLRVHLALRCRL